MSIMSGWTENSLTLYWDHDGSQNKTAEIWATQLVSNNLTPFVFCLNKDEHRNESVRDSKKERGKRPKMIDSVNKLL